jgi:hypothetical protein
MSNVKPSSATESLAPELQETLQTLNVTERDLVEAKEVAGRFTLDETKRVRGPESSGFILGAYHFPWRSVDGTGPQAAFSRSQLPHPDHRED